MLGIAPTFFRTTGLQELSAMKKQQAGKELFQEWTVAAGVK